MRDGKYVILCVDDDPDLLECLRVVLEANDYIMEEAGSAEEGLQVYKETKPDLVICDLMMEEIDAGTSFVKELRAMGNKVPVYMLSSTGDMLSTSTDYSALGLNGVFQKPVDNKMLLRILKTKLPAK